MRSTSTSLSFWSALISGLLALTLTGCGSPDSKNTGDKGYIVGNGVITRLATDQRVAPGPVKGTTLEGESVSLDSFKGQVVVLNVWGSWCPPCRKEAPLLTEAARELAKEDVVFLGINTRDSSTDQGLAFQKKYDVPYPSIYDPSGQNLLSFRRTLNPNSIPSTLIIDAEGRVAASILGEIPSKATLTELVREVKGA
ncbi:MAG TPA: TlpA disulfide reductase family protein [Marmoricola sp.]|nr:TlpA disulfide reductase family protein [Marmoricola sp.]HNJ78107.1 TlpA disulfide reductase family protein [Marmoricola sp.]HNO38862.1 TlpA disulfide reductase family protein [Marmoricola sp.]